MNRKSKFALSAAALLAITGLASCGGPSSDPNPSSGSGDSSQPKGNINYTYNTYLDSNPKTWNPHAWETNSDSYILAYTEMGLYDLGFNEDRSGYKFLTEMASDFPVDVTSELTREEKARFFGRATINLPSGIAWDIPLNDKATWADGTKITADDYVESMKRLLDPEFVNHRADSWYKGNTVLANAERYFKNGQTTIEPAYKYIIDSDTLESTDPNFGQNGFWYINLGGGTPYAGTVFSDVGDTGTFYQVLNNRGSSLGDAVEQAAKRISDAVAEGLIKIYRDGILGEDRKNSDWKNVETASDIKTDGESGNMYDHPISELEFDDLELKTFRNSEGKTKIVPEAELQKDGNPLPDEYDEYLWEDLIADITLFVRTLGRPSGAASKTDCWKLPLFGDYENVGEGVEWESVGIEKIDDYKIRLIMEPSSAVAYNDLLFSLTSNWIVKTSLYDDLSMTVAGTTLKATKYGTASADNYMSYGPYKLTRFQTNKLIVLERNENWYGYKDGKHENQYQMEVLDTQIVDNHTTAMQMFEQGQIDDIELTTSDMKEYGLSSRLQYTPTSYTQKLSFNVTRDTLLQRQNNQASGHSGNKTILANENFRKAISLAIDRRAYAQQCTAGSEGFYGLLNSLYISDADTGESYRQTPQAKAVYGQIYQHLGGETIDEENGADLPESALGYNLPLAAQYLKKAIDEETASQENGHFSKGDKVSMEILVYKSDAETTRQSYAFVSAALESLADATSLLYDDDKDAISFDYYMTQNEDYYNEAKQGKYDIIFSTWGGAQMNPWGLMEVYLDSTFDSNCEYGMTKQVGKIRLEMDSDGDGKTETDSLEGWYKKLTGTLKEISAADYDLEDPEEAAQYETDKAARHQQRLTILANLEAAYVKTWSTAPIISRSSASLTSYKVEYGTTSYIPLMGYGGVRYMTFSYTDAEWASMIASGEINKDVYKR